MESTSSASALPALPPGPSPPLALSKKAQKRAAKQAARDALKPKRRAQERARRKERRAKQFAEGTLPQRQPATPSTPWSGRIVLDCAFDDKMVDRELVSLSSQLRYCYSAHRKAAVRPQPVVCTSFGGQLKSRFATILPDTKSWSRSMQFTAESLETCLAYPATDAACSAGDGMPLNPNQTIYLTADSPNSLTELEADKCYVLGAIVDHNRYKNLCLERARALGLQHAALPISQYVDNLVGRRVITVNQVYELMLHWLEKRDWRAAFELAIPKRKLAPEAEAAAHPEGQPETLS